MEKQQLSKLHKKDTVKATAKELMCLKQFKEYIESNKDYKLVSEWRSIRSGFKTKSGFYVSHNNDLLGKDKLGFDIALAYKYKSIMPIFFIQVKSAFSRAYYEAMANKWRDAPVHCYLACYGKVPKSIKLNKDGNSLEADRIKLEGFTLIRL